MLHSLKKKLNLNFQLGTIYEYSYYIQMKISKKDIQGLNSTFLMQLPAVHELPKIMILVIWSKFLGPWNSFCTWNIIFKISVASWAILYEIFWGPGQILVVLVIWGTGSLPSFVPYMKCVYVCQPILIWFVVFTYRSVYSHTTIYHKHKQ